jgi:triacylglycerol esterase/lipase EstA (alpha/beta hydrolase family)
VRRALATFALVVAALAAAPAAQAGEPLPPQGAPPPGTNDFGCKPPPRHPYPVVLVHGTFENMTASWPAVAPALTRLGYCVFALDYGNSATGDIPTSAGQLQTFVDKVLSATGAAKVSIVGHSQGGMMPRYLIKFLGHADSVDDLVGLSPSNHGTTTPTASAVGPFCVACTQQIAGSDFLTHLNAGDQTPPPVAYTVIETRNDEVVTPYDSEFLPANERVTNVLLQDACPADPVEHVGVQYDGVAIQWMLNALGRPGPADPAFKPDCTGAAASTYPDSSSVGSAARVPKLVIGRPRVTHTRRAVHVAVAARNADVSGVVVTVRRHGKTLGRSRKTFVAARHVFKIRLRRRLAAGRYAVVATAPGLRTRRSARARSAHGRA